MPLPPMPSTTTLATPSAEGRPRTRRAASRAASTCSGSAAVTAHMPSLSGDPGGAASLTGSGSRLEGGAQALGGDLGHDAVVPAVVDGLGLVDEHDRDVIANGV